MPTNSLSAFGVVSSPRDEVLCWGRLFGFPFTVDNEGFREVIKGHSFRLKEPLQYNVESLFPLLEGVRPRISQNHVLRRDHLNLFLTNERSQQPAEDGVEDMDVEAGEVDVDVEPMTIDGLQEGDQIGFSFSCWRRGI